MNQRRLFCLGLLILTVAGSSPPTIAAQPAPTPKAVDLANFDFKAKPGDDFYLFVNGNWIRNHPIPSGYSAWGTFAELREQNAELLHGIVQQALQDKTAATGSAAQLLRDFYSAAMDAKAVEAAGRKQLAPYFKRIDALNSKSDLARLIGEFHQSIAPQAVFLFYRDADVDNPTRSLAAFKQGGISLPDRRYYLKEDEKSEKIMAQYRQHVEAMLRLLGESEAAAGSAADVVINLETIFAINSLTPEEERDPKLTFHKMNLAGLEKLAPSFPWKAYFDGLGLPRNQLVNVVTPDFFVGLSEMSRRIPLREWKIYLKWNVLHTNAQFLSSDFSSEAFGFFERTLKGVTDTKPRWKRALEHTEEYLGWALAQEYIRKHFSPRAKDKMLVMVGGIKDAFRQRIKALDWMGEATKREALIKLEKIVVNVGYPDKFPSLAGLEITPSGYVANVVNANRHAVKEAIRKLGEPVDRADFGMTPQTVNAYYSPPDNKIVFPSGILQPPFFHESFDDAVNYGAIGAVIAHEFTHAFDDQGSQFDGDGKLRNWWTPEDLKRFQKLQQLVVEQYNAYTVLDNLHLNGALTVGENIADLGGISIAFDAFQRQQQENGRQPEMDGFTSEQRFFIAWAQLWRINMTPEAIRSKINTSTTSYQPFRVTGPLSNHEGYINAFHLKESDNMARPADKRIGIW